MDVRLIDRTRSFRYHLICKLHRIAFCVSHWADKNNRTVDADCITIYGGLTNSLRVTSGEYLCLASIVVFLEFLDEGDQDKYLSYVNKFRLTDA